MKKKKKGWKEITKMLSFVTSGWWIMGDEVFLFVYQAGYKQRSRTCRSILKICGKELDCSKVVGRGD